MASESKLLEELGVSKDDIIKMYAEILERFGFKHLIEELSRVVGERTATLLAFRLVRATIREAVEEIIPRGLVKDPYKALLLCYRLFALADMPFEASEKPEEHLVEVRRCPHYKYTRDNPRACIVCGAMKVGALEALTGRKVMLETEDGSKFGPSDADIVVKRESHMPRGDDACRFRILVLKGGGLSIAR